MLSSNELENLQNLLKDDNKTFDDLKNSFYTLFDKSIHFKVGLTLSFLIKDHQLNLFQELSAFYILYILSDKEKGFSPFQSLAFDVMKETNIKSKKIFLIDFLKNNIRNTDNKIKDYFIQNEKNENNNNIDEEIKNIELLKNNIKINDFLINSVVSEKNIIDNKINNNFNINQLSPDEKVIHILEPNYMSYYPLNSNRLLLNNELNWILPMLQHNFIWENSTYEKVKLLLNQLLNNTPLTKDEMKYIISAIKKNPNIIKQINFSPNQMMQLIEKDESLSFEILSIICKISLNE